MIKKRVGSKRFGWRWFVVLIVLAILTWTVWNIFFSYASCDNWDCFNTYLESCDRVKFIGESDKMIFEYAVCGNSKDVCRVDVELLQGELNNQDSIALEGKRMECDLPRGVVIIPESDIGNCHGLLKEGLQDLVIKKLYTYLVQNLGKVNI